MSVLPIRRNAGGLKKNRGDAIKHGDWNKLVEATHPARVFGGNHFKERRHYDRVDFSWLMLSEASIRYRAGYFTIHGHIDVRVAETDITLTGNPEYIYVQYAWGATTATIEHSSSLPTTNSTFLRWRLIKMTPTNGVYFPAEVYWEGGSINLASPLRGAT